SSVYIRSGIQAPTGESCRRTAAAANENTSARKERNRTRPAAMPGSRQRKPGGTEFERLAGAMAAAPQFVPAERCAPHPCCPVGREPRIARGGAAYMAAPYPRAGTRVEQFSCPDQ